jgi:hypothetical protein
MSQRPLINGVAFSFCRMYFYELNCFFTLLSCLKLQFSIIHLSITFYIFFPSYSLYTQINIL